MPDTFLSANKQTNKQAESLWISLPQTIQCWRGLGSKQLLA